MTRANESQARLPHTARNERATWRTLFFVSLVNSAQASISVVGLPLYASRAELSSGQLSALLGALPLAAGLAALCIGPISDILGRKRILVLGLATLGLSLGLHPFATTFEALLALRAASGLATGVLMGLPSTLLSDVVHPARQQAAAGKTLCGYALGQTIGIPVGIALMEWSGYLLLNAMLGALALAAIPLSIAYLAPSPTRHGPFGPQVARYAKAARGTLACPRFALLAAGSFLSFAALSLFYVTFALWLFDVAQLRPTAVAPMYLGAGLLQVFLLAVVVPRLGGSARATVALSFLLNAALFALAYPAFQSVAAAALLFALTLGFVSLRIPALQFLVNNLGATEQKGLRMSLIQSCNHLGKATGAILASSLFLTFPAHQIAFASGLLSLACGLLFLAPILAVKPDPKANAASRRRHEKTDPSRGAESKNKVALARAMLTEDV